jgi:hypothetical protein
MDEIKSKTFDGTPVTYTFEGISPREEKEKPEEKIKKEKKKKNKKSKEKKKKTQSHYYLLIFSGACVVVSLLWAYSCTTNQFVLPQREPIEMASFGSNTTSESLTDYQKLPKMISLLKRGNLKPLICLHHIKTNMTGRVCLFKKHYVIVNPVLRGTGTDFIDTTESSIACTSKKEVAKRRWKHVQLQWEDDMGHVMNSKFSNGDAVAFQLMMDEFLGKC